MPTQPYFNEAAKRVPGNTTVIGTSLGWKTPGLLGWQAKIFKEQMCEACLKKLVSPNEYRDSAADAGTLCHAMIEADIKNQPMPDMSKFSPEIVAKAETGFLNYLEWKLGTKLDLLTMETPVVSEKYQYGTTIDIIARTNGKTCIVEVKSSNAIYEEYLIQVSAQRQAWNENYPDKPIEGVHLLKVNKETAAFAHLFWGELPGCFEAFLDLRDLYDRKKQLKSLL